MTSFADLTAKLNLNISGFATNLKGAAAMTKAFAANMNGQLNSSLTDPAKKAGFAFKDVGRIVAGIVVSKVFYSALQSIRSATSAVWEFAKQLEYAEVAYTSLFKSNDLAKEFINVLKDFAAVTPFAFSDAEAAAKRLLAYGLKYKNVMYVMQGVLSASTMQNNPAATEAISRALGQIYTKGRLMNEEMRQLAEAGIPVYEILQEKLGLTVDQLRNLGKTAIPASAAINALVDGMNERFGGALEASATTMQGIVSNIKDNATMLGAGLFDPLIGSIKRAIGTFGDFLAEARKIYELKGIGGVFERFIPPSMQDSIRMLVANLANLWTVLKVIFQVLGQWHMIMGDVTIRLINAFLPAVTAVLDVVARLTRAILSNSIAVKVITMLLTAAAAGWVLFKLKAVAAFIVSKVIQGISLALKGMSTALTFIVAHPFWALMIGLVALVIGLSGGFGKLSDAINGVFNSLSKMNGIDPDKVLLPESKERSADLEKFNDRLAGTSEEMENLAASTGAAAKAAKGLLGFDEVFKLQDQDEKTDTPNWDEIAMPEMEPFDLEGLMPVQADFAKFGKDFVDNVWGALKDNLGALGLAAALGYLLTQGLKGGLDALKSAIANLGIVAGTAMVVWSIVNILEEGLDIKNFLIGALGGALAGAGIGWKVGGPKGALLGATIGMGVSIVAMAVSDMIFEGGITVKNGLVAALGGALAGAGIGWKALGGKGGMLVGATVGIGVSLVAMAVGDMVLNGGLSIKNGLIAALGSVLTGAGIGWKIGGPHGALIGATVGIGLSVLFMGVGDMLDGGKLTALNLALTGLGTAILGVTIAIKGAAIISGATVLFEKFGYTILNLIPSVGKLGNSANQSFAGIGAGVSLAVAGVALLATSIINCIMNWDDMDTKGKILAIGMGILGAAAIALGVAIALGISTATLGIGAIVAAIAAAVAAIIGFIAKIVSEENATLSAADAMEKHNEAVEEAKLAAEELTAAEGELTQAKKDLAAATDFATSAIDSYEGAVKKAEETSTALKEAEAKLNISGAELQQQVLNGTLVYTDMNAKQKEVYTAYVNNESAQNNLKTATEEVNSISAEQTRLEGELKTATDKVTEATKKKTEADEKAVMAGWDVQRSLAKESGSYDEYKKSVIDAFSKGELSAKQAQELIGKSMTGMSKDVRKTFMEDMPADIKAGLDPKAYETTGEKIGNWFKNVGNSMVSGFKSIFGIKSPSKVMKDIAGNIEDGLKGGISGESVGSWFSNIGSKMVNGFKSIFGIKSPSREMAGIGENIEKGLLGGMDGMAGNVCELFEDTYKSAVAAIEHLQSFTFDWSKFFGASYDGFDDWFKALFDNISAWLEAISTKIDTWWTDTWDNKNFNINGGSFGGVLSREKVTSSIEANRPNQTEATSESLGVALANGLAAILLPLISRMTGNQNQSQLQPLYLGTLIADDRGLRELNRKMQIIKLEDENRRG